jgi:hypothetical protein
MGLDDFLQPSPEKLGARDRTNRQDAKNAKKGDQFHVLFLAAMAILAVY